MSVLKFLLETEARDDMRYHILFASDSSLYFPPLRHVQLLITHVARDVPVLIPISWLYNFSDRGKLTQVT